MYARAKYELALTQLKNTLLSWIAIECLLSIAPRAQVHCKFCNFYLILLLLVYFKARWHLIIPNSLSIHIKIVKMSSGQFNSQ